MAIKNLNSVLKSLDYRDAIEKGLANGIERAAQLVLASAKFNCPVDTGALRNSIKAEITGTSFEVGTDLYYAKFVEFGTVKQRPQPYLYPAIAENRKRIIEIVQEEIRKELSK